MNTKALRQKILHLAIHGKLVPQNPKNESATVLLERIRAEKDEKIKRGELKADKKDSFIFVGSDKRHYEQFADGTVKDIEDEIPFDVPESWAWCRLGEAGIITDTGYPFDASLFTNDSKNRKQIIRIRDILRGYSETYSDENCPDSYIVNKDDILIGMDGDFNIAKWKTDGALLNQRVCRINKNNELINLDYVFYLLPIPLLEINKNTSSVTVKHLSNKQIENLIFPIPPFNEQNRIVNHLENIFSQIRMLEQNKSVLQTAIKQAKSKILDLAIHGKLVPQDPNDEPAEELLKRIATGDNRPYEKVDSSEIDWKLPKNWTLCHFGDIATIINGKNQSKVENPDGKYPIYGSGGIMGRADDYICPENCTIIGRKGSINNPIFVEEKFWNVDTAFGLCPSEAVLPKFLFYFCEYFDFTALDSSTTLPSLTKTNIQQIIFALPPIEEQERILDKTDELFDSLDEIVLNLV